MSAHAVLSGEARWHLHQGEALAWLQTLPDACVDCVCVDPPYSSGGQFRSDRAGSTSSKYTITGTQLQHPEFLGDNRDQRSFLTWCLLWLSECLRVSRPGAPILVFTDWRQLPTTTDALQLGGWVWRGVVPWNKTSGCRPTMGRFAAQCEYIVWGSNGPMGGGQDIGCLPGFLEEYPNPRDKWHIAGKPVAMLREALAICPAGGIVLDAFAGSASAGVAALESGRRYLACELSGEYAPVGRKRLADAEQGMATNAAASRAGQMTLPGGAP